MRLARAVGLAALLASCDVDRINHTTGRDASTDAPGSVCNPAFTVNGAVCSLHATCMQHQDSLECDGTTCSCSVDGSVQSSFAQATTCGSQSTALQAWSARCGFP